jgi:hypothetical protein
MRRPLLLSLSLFAIVVACYKADTTEPQGKKPVTRVLLTDAPFPYDSVRSVDVYFDSIALSTSSDTTPANTAWITVAAPLKTYDLLALQNGSTAIMGEGTVPAGQYRAVRVVIQTDKSSITSRAGTAASVNWCCPNGRRVLYALVQQPLAISDTGASVVLDFDVGRSFVQLYTGAPFQFLAYITAVNAAATGSLQGTVAGGLTAGGSVAIPNATVSAFVGDPAQPANTWWLEGTARTDSSGNYKFGYLLPGSYNVRVDAPGARQTDTSVYRFFSSVTQRSVSVARGVTTAQSFTLPEVRRSTLMISGPLTMLAGDTADVSVIVTDSLGNALTAPVVTWTSRSTAVATIVPDSSTKTTRRIAGLAAGKSWIVAASASLTDSLQMTVNQR